MNKRIIALITSLLLILSAFPAFASASVSSVYTTLSGEQSGDTWEVTLSGTSAQKAGTVVMMNLLYPGVDIAELGGGASLKSQTAYTDMTSVAEDGTFSFTIPLNDGDVGGVYKAYVLIPGESAPLCLEIPCMNYGRRAATLDIAQNGTAIELRDSLVNGIGDLSALSSDSYKGYDNLRREYVAQYIIENRNMWDASDDDSDKLSGLEVIIGDAVTSLDTILELANDDREGIANKLVAELADVEAGGNGIMMLDPEVLASYGALSDTEKEAAIVAMEGYKNTFVLPASVDEALRKSVEIAEEPEVVVKPSKPQNGGGGGGGFGGGSISRVEAGKDFVIENQPTEILEAKDEFSDLSSAPWAKDAINILASEGVLSGTGDGTFCPQNTITRAQFAQMVVKAFDIPLLTEKAMSFTDVNRGDWYHEAIQILCHRGIVNGISSTEFGVNQPITRQDMAVIINRTMSHLKMTIAQGNEITFADEADISDYAKNSVTLLTKTGIINGKENGTFAPKDTATRAEAAVIIYRIMYAMKLL